MITRKFMPYMISGLFILSITSCSKQSVESFPAPELSARPANNGRDSLAVGENIVFHPKLNHVAASGYSWTINDVQAGRDSVYTFRPESRGDYQIKFRAVTNGGELRLSYNIHVWDKYENGFYIANEGWFGHGSGTVSFYSYHRHLLQDSVFVRENPGRNLGSASATLQSGVIYNKKMYLVTKAGGPVVVTDAYSMKEQSRIPATAGSYWLSFVGVDAAKGLLSSTKGLFPFDLNTMAVGPAIAGLSGQVGDLIKEGSYIFALSQSSGLVVLKAADLSVVKTLAGAAVGFTKTADGMIWAAGGNKIFKVNPATLEVETISSPFTIYGSWGAWHPGSIAASTKENAVFIAKSGSFGGGTEIYKYVPGNAASLQSPFATLPTGKIFYGAGISYNEQLDQLLATTVQSGYGDNYRVNAIYFYHPVNGVIQRTVSYDGFYFPSVIVYHK